MDKHKWGREPALSGFRDTRLLRWLSWDLGYKQLSLDPMNWKEGPGLPPWSPKLAESKAQLNFVAWRLLTGGNFESLQEAR